MKVGSVIQVNEKCPEWCGCLMIVEKIGNSWAICSMNVPDHGVTYMWFKFEEMEYIGEALFVFDCDAERDAE